MINNSRHRQITLISQFHVQNIQRNWNNISLGPLRCTEVLYTIKNGNHIKVSNNSKTTLKYKNNKVSTNIYVCTGESNKVTVFTKQKFELCFNKQTWCRISTRILDVTTVLCCNDGRQTEKRPDRSLADNQTENYTTWVLVHCSISPLHTCAHMCIPRCA